MLTDKDSAVAAALAHELAPVLGATSDASDRSNPQPARTLGRRGISHEKPACCRGAAASV